MKIAFDVSPVIHGKSAIKRHMKNLVETIIRFDTANDYKLLYFDWKWRRNHHVSLPSSHNVKEYNVPVPERFLRSCWKYLYLPKSECLIGEFDIFYATDLYFPPSSHGLILSSIHGIAYHMIEDMIDPKLSAGLKEGLVYTLKHADYLLAVSHKTRENLIERIGVSEERIYVVSHGVDPRFMRLQNHSALSIRLKEKLGFSTPYILFVGVIGNHKNIMGLLRAYSILLKQGYDIPLVLAGPPGSAWEEAKNWIAKEGLEEKARLIGYVDQDSNELLDLYNGAFLFVFPSFYEGWTSPPLEAMACGTPVITSNCSSLPETVGSAAILVDPNNPEKLAFEMERVLCDQSLRNNLIAKGIKHAFSHTWEKAAAKLLDVCADVYARGPWKESRE